MSFIIVIVKIVRIVIRNVVTEIHDCYLLLVGGAGIEPASLRHAHSVTFHPGILTARNPRIHVFDAAIRSGNNNVGMPHDLIYKIIWRPVAFSHLLQYC